MILRLCWDKVKHQVRKGDWKFGEENQYLRNWGGAEYKVLGNFIHPRKSIEIQQGEGIVNNKRADISTTSYAMLDF